MNPPRTDPSWRTLYLIGAASAAAFVVMVLVPVVLLFAAPIPPTEGRALLEYIAEHPVVYLTQLVSFVGLAVPALLVFTGAAEALIAATNAVSWAGILTAAAILILSAVMHRAGSGKAVAILGMVTGLLGIVSEAFRPYMGMSYMIYGLMLPAWFGLVGWRLWRITRVAPEGTEWES